MLVKSTKTYRILSLPRPCGTPAKCDLRRLHLLSALQLLKHRRQPPVVRRHHGQRRRGSRRNSYVSNYRLMRLMMDAGLPGGVTNFVQDGPLLWATFVAHRSGSTYRFNTSFPPDVARRGQQPREPEILPSHRRRNGRQGLHRGPPRLRPPSPARGHARGG